MQYANLPAFFYLDISSRSTELDPMKSDSVSFFRAFQAIFWEQSHDHISFNKGQAAQADNDTYLGETSSGYPRIYC